MNKINDAQTLFEELIQRKLYCMSLYLFGVDGTLTIDSYIVCNQVTVDQQGRFNFSSKNGTEFWFNEKIRFAEKEEKDGYTQYLIHLDNSNNPVHLTASGYRKSKVA